MESIKKLRALLQEEKVHPKGWSRPWGYKTLQRGPSIYITRVLLPLPITPNQVSIFGILIGLLGCTLIIQDEWLWKFVGIIFMYINTVLDRVDGEIARYKKIYSLRGIYLDEINHLIIPPLFFLSLAFGLPLISISQITIRAAGSVAAVAVIIIRVTNSLPDLIYAKKYLKYRELFRFAPAEKTTTAATKTFTSALYPSIRFFHLFQEFFMILILFGIMLLFDLFPHISDTPYLITAYGIILFSIILSLIAVENILKGWTTVEKKIAGRTQQQTAPSNQQLP